MTTTKPHFLQVAGALIIPRQAAQIVGITRQHVTELARKGVLSGVQLANGSWLIDKNSAENYACAERRRGGMPRGGCKSRKAS